MMQHEYIPMETKQCDYLESKSSEFRYQKRNDSSININIIVGIYKFTILKIFKL